MNELADALCKELEREASLQEKEGHKGFVNSVALRMAIHAVRDAGELLEESKQYRAMTIQEREGDE